MGPKKLLCAAAEFRYWVRTGFFILITSNVDHDAIESCNLIVHPRARTKLTDVVMLAAGAWKLGDGPGLL